MLYTSTLCKTRQHLAIKMSTVPHAQEPRARYSPGVLTFFFLPLLLEHIKPDPSFLINALVTSMDKMQASTSVKARYSLF